MQIGIRKVGERDGQERFVLYNRKTGDPIVKKDNSEATLRKWLAERDFDPSLVKKCFELARRKFSERPAKPAPAKPAPAKPAAVQPAASSTAPEDSDDMDLDFFLAEMDEEEG